MRGQGERRFVLLYTVVLCLLLFFCVSEAGAADVKVSNVAGGQFTVSWVTADVCRGKVFLYQGSRFVGDYSDDRGKAFLGTTHYVTVRGLREKTGYGFSLNSGERVDDNGGSLYRVMTGPHLVPAGSIQPAGRVLLSDDESPAVGSIVYVSVSDSGGVSAPLSTLVDENGYWYVELINARRADHQRLFPVTEGSGELRVSVEGGELGTAYLQGPVMDNQGGTNLYALLVLR